MISIFVLQMNEIPGRSNSCQFKMNETEMIGKKWEKNELIFYLKFNRKNFEYFYYLDLINIFSIDEVNIGLPDASFQRSLSFAASWKKSINLSFKAPRWAPVSSLRWVSHQATLQNQLNIKTRSCKSKYWT